MITLNFELYLPIFKQIQDSTLPVLTTNNDNIITQNNIPTIIPNISTPNASGNIEKTTDVKDTKKGNNDVNINEFNLNRHPTKLYRDREHKIESIKKFINGTGELFVIHFRKAGGTTIKMWIQSIARILIRKHNDKNLNYKWKSKITPLEIWYHSFIMFMHDNLL